MSRDADLDQADRDLRAALRGLREVTPPPSLAPMVMRRIAEPAATGLWGWLRRRRRLSVSPLGLLVGAACAAAVVFTVRARVERRESMIARQVAPVTARSSGAASAPKEAVVVRFVLRAEGATSVAVAGDFNDWDGAANVLAPSDGQGTFAGILRLPRGTHEYLFVIDGKEWRLDPAASETRPDGFGRVNAVLRL